MAARMNAMLLIRSITKIAFAQIRLCIQTAASRVTPLFANIPFVGRIRHVAGGAPNKTNPIRYE
jgi:hypothetical protein